MKNRKKFIGAALVTILTMMSGMTVLAAAGEGAQMPDYTPMPFDGTIISVEEDRIVMNRNYGWGTEEMIVTVSEDTKVLDAVNGYPISISNLSEGENIRAYVGMAMTLSLPPLANGVVVFGDIPADAGFPIYTDVQEVSENTDGSYTLKTIDGTVVKVNENTMLLPYLTRNLIRVEDLVPGSRILLWTEGSNSSEAYKIVLFPNPEGGFGPVAEQGWKETDEGWYFYENGELKTGWLFDRGDWYYLNPETGLMHTGFITLNGKTYYLKEDGRMLTEAHVFTPDENGELKF